MPPSRRERPKTRPWSRPLADLVSQAIDPVLARQGFSESDLILHWDDIVGERLAATSRPIKLQWPPRSAGPSVDSLPQPATLVVRVESAFAVELQHMADQILSRINAHLGWRCVGRLVLKQGPIERTGDKVARRPALTDDALASAARHVGEVADDGLREALCRLGARVAQSAR